jgi:hypothetical protein
MAKFRFYQDKEVKTWVRDYYTIEADTLEEAIKRAKEADCTLEDLEEKDSSVEFQYRDWDWMQDALIDVFEEDMIGFSIFSCDLEDDCAADCEIVSKY